LKTIDQMWESYQSIALPKDAPQYQIDGSKYAFYAGAAILFNLIVNANDGLKEYLKLMDTFNDEFEKHFAELAKKGNNDAVSSE